jgi:mono/diheme cytochrome c family protein
MKRFLKVVGILIGALVAIVAITLVTVIVLSNRRQAAHYEVDCPSVTLPTGEDALAEGRRLFTTRGCVDCHAEDGGGKVIMDAPPGLLVGTNLTEVATRYSDQDFVRAIRHGVAKDGRPLLMMPSLEFWEMSDRDVGMILAYVRSLPRVERDLPTSELRPLGNALHVFGLFPAISAEKIDHDAPRPREGARSPSARRPSTGAT